MKIMTNLLAVALLSTGFAQAQVTNLVATMRGEFEWHDPNPPEAVQGYFLRLTGPTNDTWFIQAPQTNFPVVQVFANWPNGIYTATVSVVSKSETESAPCPPLTFFWYGQLVPITNINTRFFRVTDQ